MVDKLTKVTVTKISKSDLIQDSFEYNASPGQHQMGVVIARFNYAGENEWEIFDDISQEDLQTLIASGDKGIGTETLRHSSPKRGSFQATWYYALYSVPSSLDLPTKLDEKYDGKVTVEIVFSFNENDSQLTRVIKYEYETGHTFPAKLADLDLQEVMWQLMEDSSQGFSKNDDGDYTLVVYDFAGNGTPIDIFGTEEVANSIVSIRLI